MIFWYLLYMRAANIQTSMGIHAVSPEHLLLAHCDSNVVYHARIGKGLSEGPNSDNVFQLIIFILVD